MLKAKIEYVKLVMELISKGVIESVCGIVNEDNLGMSLNMWFKNDYKIKFRVSNNDVFVMVEDERGYIEIALHEMMTEDEGERFIIWLNNGKTSIGFYSKAGA